jgi:hypothetical protein
VAQVVECLPTKCKVLSSNPNIGKKINKHDVTFLLCIVLASVHCSVRVCLGVLPVNILYLPVNILYFNQTDQILLFYGKKFWHTLQHGWTLRTLH